MKRLDEYPVRLIIAGGRDFNDYGIAYPRLDFMLENIPKSDIIIVEGGALGADRVGRNYAIDRGLAFKTFDADWDNIDVIGAVVRVNRKGKKYNAKAGHDRNQEMAEAATHLIAFWDGKSTGTKDMITRAEIMGLKIKVFYY